MQAMIQKTATAVVYRRVSSERQSGEKHVSLEVQAQRTQVHIRQRGYTLGEVFTDVASGRRDNREHYQRMLDHVRRGGASVIVTQFLDRFGRNPKEILRRVWELQDLRVQVECSDEDVSQELPLLIKAFMAGAESRRIGERVRHTIRRSVESKNMKIGRAPYGFKPVKRVDGSKVVTVFEQDPVEAPIVRLMFDMRVRQNLGLKVMSDRLNEAGYRTRTGKMWAGGSITYILQSPSLKGLFIYGRQPGKGAPDLPTVSAGNIFPAILSDEEWEALQERIRLRRAEGMRYGKGHISVYLLSGLTRCAHCGGGLPGRTGMSGSKHKRKVYRAYHCANAAKSRSKCGYPNFHKAEPLEQAVMQKLAEYADQATAQALFDHDQERDMHQLHAEGKRIDARLAELASELKFRMGLLRKGLIDDQQFGLVSQAERHERQQLQTRQAVLEEDIRARRERQAAAASLPGKISGFLESAAALPVTERKARVQEIIRRILVGHDGSVTIEWR